MRRRVGIAGLKKRKEQTAKFQEQAAVIDADHMAQMTAKLDLFRDNLEKFAQQHKSKINKNPVFRAQFTKMCMDVGVDPLASNKGFWAQLLGVVVITSCGLFLVCACVLNFFSLKGGFLLRARRTNN